ncbi:MAG: hypothetical protein KAS32_04860 [Candidatus Peribacteraceae bacterium]|nr:hypothetical protein [Candidatus Peribacteraceae bacterium]
MGSSEIFSGLVGFAMPWIVEVIKSKLPKTKGKWLGYVLAYGIAILVGGGSSYLGGEFDPQNILSSVGSALIISQGVYNLYFKPKKIDRKIERALR